MTVIEQKALALLGEVSPYKCEKVDHAHHAYLCAALRLSVERHEAAEHELADCKQELADFKQKVSDAAQEYEEAGYCMGWEGFERFIIPKPQPDPLVEVLKALPVGRVSLETYSRNVRAALDAAGFEIREKNDG